MTKPRHPDGHDAGPTMTPASIGAYRLVAPLGHGGMGEVFLAWDERLKRNVAIKRIRDESSRDDATRDRFRREARAVAQLNHPAIVQVFDVIEGDGGSGDSIVMEYVEGRSLLRTIAAGDLDLLTVVRLAGEIAAGLGEAHSKGLVHRDLKPENVMLTAGPRPRAKILDFGLARALWKEALTNDSGDSLTQSGAVVGTAYAMSPEQANGCDVDHRSDLFALGNLIYHVLSGTAPFRGESVLDTLQRVHAHHPPPIRRLRPDVPPALNALTMKLLAKDPAGRPANARLVEEELRRIAVELETAAPGLPMVRASGATPSAALGDLPTHADASPLENAATPPDAQTESRVETVVRTLVLTDLVDSTRLVESLGDLRSSEVFARHDRMARDLLARHEGLEIDKTDGFLLLFRRPFDAIGYTLGYHRALAELAAELDVALAARAAVHLGEVVLRYNNRDDISRGAKPIEVEGLAKPTAARLMSLAGARQTLLSRSAFDLGRRSAVDEERWDEGLRWLAHGNYVVKGVDEPVEVFEVGISGVAPLAAPADSEKARRAATLSDELVLGWRPAAGQAIPRRPHWTLAERLGEGGFGEVWLARHKSGEVRVFKFCFEADKLRGLKREVTLFRLLRDALGQRSDIARILDWSFEEAPYFLEVEHTEGGSLVDWAEAQGGIAAVPLETRSEIAAQVAVALGAAHSVGILHKDVKPGNILVFEDVDGHPRIRLADFGISRLTDEAVLAQKAFTIQGMTEQTATSSTGGTRIYMAPELLEGKPASIQADVYSLGVVIYQMAAGDFSRALAAGWERDVDDEILAEDIALFVDGTPEQRARNALDVAERLRSLETRRRRRQAERSSRRRRRMAFAATALLSLLLALVSIFALQAVRARDRERTLYEDADLRRQQAEGLIEFMLGDLHDKLEPLGRLDILNEIGDQAMVYFASVPAEKLTDDELFQRSEALIQLGLARLDEGDLEAARAIYEEAFALAQSLAERDPHNVQWQTRLGAGHFYIGRILWMEGDLDQALERFQAQLEISERLAGQHPDDFDLRLELANSRNNIGFVQQAQGKLEEATDAFRFALQVTEALAEEQPDDNDLQLEYIYRLAALGSLLWQIGEVGEAKRDWELGLSVAETVLAQDSSNTFFQVQRAVLHRVLGEALASASAFQDAQRHFQIGLEVAEELVALEPERTAWQLELAIALRNVGLDLARQKRAEEAQDHVHRGLRILSGLAARQSTLKIIRGLADAHLSVGFAEAELGNRPSARRRVGEALALLEPLADERPEDRETHRRLGEALLLLGRIEPSSSEAREIWERAAMVLEPFARESRDLHLLGPWQQALELLGRRDEAAAVEHRRGELSWQSTLPQS